MKARSALALAVALAGCGSEVSGPVRPGDCTDLALGVTPNTLAVGGAALVVSDPSATGLSWSVTDPSVAAVDPSGSTLEPLDTGSTYLRVTDDRGRSCSVEVSVRAGNVVSRTRSPDVPFGPLYPMFSAREPGRIEVLQTGPPPFPVLDPGAPGPTQVATIDGTTGGVSNPRIPSATLPLALIAELAHQGIIDDGVLFWDLAEFQATADGYLGVFAPTTLDNPVRGPVGPLGAAAMFLDEQARTMEFLALRPPDGTTDECSVFAGAALHDDLLYLAVSRYRRVAPGECAALERIELHAGPPPAGPLEPVLSIPSGELAGFAVAEESRPLTDTVSGADPGVSPQLRTPQLEPATLSNGRTLLALQDRVTARALLIDTTARRIRGRIDLSDAVSPADHDARTFVWGPGGEFWLITTVGKPEVEDPESLPALPADYDLASLTPIADPGDTATISVTGGLDVALTAIDDLLRGNVRLRLPTGLAERGGTLVVEGMDGSPTYSSTDASVAAVESSGNVALGHAGSAQIRVTASRGESFDVPLEVRELSPLGRSPAHVGLDAGTLIAVAPVGDAEGVALVDASARRDPCEPEELVLHHVVDGVARQEIPLPALGAPATPGPGGPDLEEWFTAKDVAFDAGSGTYWVAGSRTSCFSLDGGLVIVPQHRPTLIRIDGAGRRLEELLLEPLLGLEASESTRARSVQIDPRPDGSVLVGVEGELRLLGASGSATSLYEHPSFDRRTSSLDEIRSVVGGAVLLVFSRAAVTRRGSNVSGASPERDIEVVLLEAGGAATRTYLDRIEELVTGLERDGDNLRVLLADRSGAQAPDLVLTGLASFGD